MPAENRAMRMNVEHETRGDGGKDGDICMDFNKECQCTMLCFAWPELEVR